MADQELEVALSNLEATANSFAVRLIRMAEVRSAYVQQIHEMATVIRQEVASGTLSAARGAELANETRNVIMEMQRGRDFDLGRALAQKWKKQGLSLEECIQKAMGKQKLNGPFNQLTGPQQRQVYEEVVDAAGRSRAKVTAGIPRLQWAARGLWIATLAIAAYNIGTAENPWWQSGREASNIAGGLTGGFAGGAAMGALAGVWGGPIGVGIGIVVGGVLGTLLADRAYVEIAGTSDPRARTLIGRFASFWTGVDEEGMAKALASEYKNDLSFVGIVLQALNNDYSTDADDVAVEYVQIIRKTPAQLAAVKSHPDLSHLLIETLNSGWTASDEQEAIKLLQSTAHN